MPHIFDNIDLHLLKALRETLPLSERADFCVGYFNLRGWKQLDEYIERWGGGEGNCCRLLVGMQRLPQDELREAMRLSAGDGGIDNQTAHRLKQRLAQEFRDQLTVGAPTNEDERGLRRLAAQIKGRKVVVKLFLRHPLHAKLYLLFRPDPINPAVAYLGSSNLTLAGLAHQGELNVDVMDSDACAKLARWFEDRWTDHWCVDISDELAAIIDASWAREEPIPPYHIYLKIAYHLSREAREGLTEFRVPREFGNKLLPFQVAAVKIAAHHVNRRRGVFIGDVVGLGKTLMATAAARILEDDHGLETLIICPKNLVSMWEGYVHQYRLRGKVLSLSEVLTKLPELRRYRIVIIDESHNLRNREGKRFRAIQEYIAQNESRVILLSATPYNKTYVDLANQLRLFVAEDEDLGIRPERLLRELGETEFLRRHQCPMRSLAAFEHSPYADDWRNLMRLYMVRRTRSFIKDNYALTDPETGRKYLELEGGGRSYFPERVPKKVPFDVDDDDPEDQYARLYAHDVVDTINALGLPRYGLANYIESSPHSPPSAAEDKILRDLSRAGRRLMGFCRTNLFKRLESSGEAFLQSIERHILRNYIFLHAIEHGLALPIGTQDAGLLDPGTEDEDLVTKALFDDAEDGDDEEAEVVALRTEEDFRRRASEIYGEYAAKYRTRFKWLRSDLFIPQLAEDLRRDAMALLGILRDCGDWDSKHDAKLNALVSLLTKKHGKDKVVVFTQFADTVRYLTEQLRQRGINQIAGVSGKTDNPVEIAQRFSPEANEIPPPSNELRVLVSTDILSEGLNLHDCHIVVNYDLPWALIRLTQRVGRVDRIGQKAERILCYYFLPAEGIERIIGLRGRLRQRLLQNREVVGTDEAFFEDEDGRQFVLDLYNEKANLLDDPRDAEVDLASEAYEIWHKATKEDSALAKAVSELPAVVYSARAHTPTNHSPAGVIAYLRTAQDNDALVWLDEHGGTVTESPIEILRMAKCEPDTPPVPRSENHHDLVRRAAELVAKEERSVGGQLGRPSGARFRTYERLKGYADRVKGTLFESEQLDRAIEDIYRYPLRQSAVDTLNHRLRAGVSDEALAELVINLREAGRLCLVHEGEEPQEPQIICSLGLVPEGE